MRRRWRVVLATIALAGASARPAAAQDPNELERAKASFKAGANAYAAGDYPAAIQALDAAYELTPLPAIAFSLAQAERKLYAARREREHLERAVKLFRRYLEQEPNGARRGDAQLALGELEPQLGGAPAREVPAKAQTRPTRVMIVSDVPGARIALDGGPLSSSPLIREVQPGKHRAHVEARGYDDVDRDVTAVAGELILSEVGLHERPTPLYVWAPAGSEIYVDGVFVAEGGPRANVALATGPHQLIVAQKGRRVARRDLVLERGRPRVELVMLEPTTQRFVSELMFIAGGATLGAGVVLSAFAVRSQNSAETFLAHRTHRTLTNAERIAYTASLVERDRYRTAATAGIVGSLGFFITGLFLRELDRPSLAAAPHREFNGGPKGELSQPRVAWSVLSPTGDPGASLQLNF